MRFRKRTKVLRFPYSPTFHENYELDLKTAKKTKNPPHNKTLNWTGELNYEQLWCAPMQRDAAWGEG